VGSTDAANIVTDKSRLAEDLASFADQLAQHKFRLCYENWCWSTHAPTWKDVHELTQLSSRPNLGLCLDTFQTAGYEWGDPTSSSGRREDKDAATVDDEYQKSLQQLSTTVRPEQIYVLQVSDAYRPTEPLQPEADPDGLRPRGRWSQKFRPQPGTEGGYLPIVDFGVAVLKTGFRGWFSLEVFDAGAEGRGQDLDKTDLVRWAKRAHASLAGFIDQCERAASL
jgi:sugar phosphate isomerase/epimerase